MIPFMLFVNEAKGERIPLAEAEKLAEKFAAAFKKVTGASYIGPTVVKADTEAKKKALYAVGSMRRRKADVGDFDFISTVDVTPEQIAEIEGTGKVTGRKAQLFFNWTDVDSEKTVSINIWMIPEGNFKYFGGLMVQATGSSEFNIHLRSAAKASNQLINNKGVYNRETLEFLGGASEEEFFKAVRTKNNPNGLKWKAPEERK